MSTNRNQDSSLQFRTSPLGQRLTSLSNPSDALHLLSRKRQQYTVVQQEITSTQQQKFQALVDQLIEERERMGQMPTVRRRFKQRRRPESRVSDALNVRPMSPQSPVPLTGLWHRLDDFTRHPEAREGATLTPIHQKLILTGGASRSIFNDIWVLYALNPQWTQARPPGPLSEPRMGHSAVTYKQEILLFGGVTAYNRVSQTRECVNTIRCLNPSTMEWKAKVATGEAVVMRRYHSAAVVGKHMLVYGGLSEKNVFLGDCIVLNLESWKWKTVEIHGKGPGRLAFHSTVSVYPGFSSESFDLFSSANDSPAQSLPYPGVYLYGGIDSNSTLNPALYILQTGQRPLSWCFPSISGRYPSPRYQHTLILSPELHSLILFGGRNNELNSGGYACFGDVHLLDLVRMEWKEVEVKGEGPGARCAHVMGAVGRKVLVFGGFDGGKYCSGDTFILEIDGKSLQIGEFRRNISMKSDRPLSGLRGKPRTHSTVQSKSTDKPISSFL